MQDVNNKENFGEWEGREYMGTCILSAQGFYELYKF